MTDPIVMVGFPPMILAAATIVFVVALSICCGLQNRADRLEDEAEALAGGDAQVEEASGDLAS
ncbi:MAG: hypothetical protein Q4B30_04035 [Coriobacteriaceae bacterium]|nr:hypothetical protein [Coriobacteriaceae bacterium]